MKCIVSDLDGTLLSMDKTISKANLDAIAKAQEQGIELMIATGREYRSVREILLANQLRADAILMNGAQLRNENGDVLTNIALPTASWQAVYHLLDRYDIGAIFNYTNLSYAISGNDDLKSRMQRRFAHLPELESKMIIELLSERYWKSIVQVHTIDELASVKEEVLKIELFDFKDDTFDAMLSDLHAIGNLSIVTYGNHSMEVTVEQAQKGILLEQVIADKGYAKEDVMVIGDGMNDISMFERFPCSVAMGNANETVASTATHRTKTNAEDGVAHAIEKFCLA